ncbi:MAG: amidase [Robiginitomaculum sp.]|nr:MAG: amidase [Robiginitomaculum sp.]
MRHKFSSGVLALALSALVLSGCTPPQTSKQSEAASVSQSKIENPAPFGWSLPEISAAVQSGELSSSELVAAYLARIEAVDRAGPQLQSILTLNLDAMNQAKALDAELVAGNSRGPLHGIPILVKDNIETRDPMPTTAGSTALQNNLNHRDAPLIANLREAGAVILGKTNLSQWANFRSNASISGWSALGGQTRNPHILDRSPCGSSAGSGVAVAAFLTSGAIGTETNGSISCPSARNGIVGFKPTVGLVSQRLIIPISSTQDTAGPMTLSVEGAALMLDGMTGRSGEQSFTRLLKKSALDGKRIGVLRFAQGKIPAIQDRFEKALLVLEEAGAVLIDIDTYEPPKSFWDDSFAVLQWEFKETLNAYLAGTSEQVKTRSLAELIAFNQVEREIEQSLFDQDVFEMSEARTGLDDPEYLKALNLVLTATRQDGIDRILGENQLDLLVAPTGAPAFLIDPVFGDGFPGGNTGGGWMAAIAGYPHLTVPMGSISALPVGISFMGAAGQDAEVLAAGYAYEIRSAKRVIPQFLPSADAVPSVQKAFMRRPRPASE